MKTYCKADLLKLKKLISSLNDGQYSQTVSVLGSASIGQHVRHVLEFYLCLLKGAPTKEICYDKRERNNEIETNRSYALYTIEKIYSNIGLMQEEQVLKIEANMSDENESSVYFNSTGARELAYCLEHAIHHYALIKVALHEIKIVELADKDFGVAPATIRYRKQCAQ